VIASLEELDDKALVRVLTEPKNSLIRQYEKLFSYEKVKLKFTDSAVLAVARKARAQKTGARGLRTILEEVMLDLMYEIPSQEKVDEVIINEEVINKINDPILIYNNKKNQKSA
ncbi:MAG TPA: ATP-dependent Clp protease ATP-binding subunit ClpX, partial [Nitrospiria bacterium]|nr:ATP-dependent Clp protease ATP-binding subunit ClpX [Nitrospiria bacterium]